MKPEHIATVAVRLFAIALIVYAVRNGLGIATVYFTRGSGSGFYPIAIVTLLLVAAFFLWRFANTVASKLVKYDDAGTNASASISADELQIVAFSVLGIYFLFKAITDGVYWLFWFILVRPESWRLFLGDEDHWASIFTTIAELILACFLVFGARGIAGMIRKARRVDIGEGH